MQIAGFGLAASVQTSCGFALVVVPKGVDVKSESSKRAKSLESQNLKRAALTGISMKMPGACGGVVPSQKVVAVSYQICFKPAQSELLFLAPSDFLELYPSDSFVMYLVKEQEPGFLTCASSAMVMTDVKAQEAQKAAMPKWWWS